MRGPCCLVLIVLTAGVSRVLSSVPIQGLNYYQKPGYLAYPGAHAYTGVQAYAHAQSPVGYARAQAAYTQYQPPYAQTQHSAFAQAQYRPAYAQPHPLMQAGYYPKSFSSMPAACPASCPQTCYPQCTTSCCSPPPPPPPLPTPPPPPPPSPPPPSCPVGCPKWCIPKCNVECCNPKPPPMPEYLQRQQLTATACEGKKLRITCPNRSDKIILYSTFYGRDDNNTCHHQVLPSTGFCNHQEHRVNEKVFNLCGHERRCIVAVNNKFLAADNTTICPGLYKYLKVIYKCSQHPKIFPICPLPCQNPKNCFPKCKRDCCSPQPKKTAKVDVALPVQQAPRPPPRPASCPAACPSYCKPPCTPQCCYGEQQQQQQQQQQQRLQPQQRVQSYGVLSSYFAPRPKQTRPSYLSMYGTQVRVGQYPQPQQRFFSRQYSSNPRRLFSSYTRHPMSPSACPETCRRTCAPGCPRQCCPVVTRKPDFKRFMTRLDNQSTLWD